MIATRTVTAIASTRERVVLVRFHLCHRKIKPQATASTREIAKK